MNRSVGSHVSDDVLIDLAAGLLDPAGRSGALEHMRACADCERRFLQTFRDSERLALRRPSHLEQPASEDRARSFGFFRRLRWGAAAAILLMALVLADRAFRRPADGLDYWLPLESERLLLRSASPAGGEDRYREAIEAYARRDVRRVVELLHGQPIPKSYQPLELILASSLLWEGQLAEAREVLDRLQIRTLPQPARDRALWMLYTALRRDGRRAEAREVATTLAALPGEFSERAIAELARH